MKQIRTCVVCRQKFNKKNLNRLYLDANLNVQVDNNQTAQARASYVCYNTACHQKMLKQKTLNKAFRKQIQQENYEAILNNLKRVESKIDKAKN